MGWREHVAIVAAIPAAPVLAVMALGLVVAIGGHVYRNSRTVATGIALLFIATALMVLLAYFDYQGNNDSDPRPQHNPSSPTF